MKVYRPITLDCTIDNLKREKITGYEHGVTEFEITFTNKRQQIPLSEVVNAVYHGTKADDHIVTVKCEIKDNKVYLPVILQMTTCFGYLNGQLELQSNTGNIRFYGLNFEVFPSPETAQIESTDENTLLESFILKPKEHGTKGQVLAVDENGNTYWTSVTGGSGSGGTSDYNELENIPTLNGKPIQGDLTTADFGIENGKDYILTESDKAEIAEIIKTDYDAELLEILGGDEDVAE